MRTRTTVRRSAVTGTLILVLAGTAAVTPAGAAAPPPGHEPPRVPTSVGYGGAVSSLDPVVSEVGLTVLRRGGNATDAAVAMAAAIGVTDPYSAGIGGGGFFVHYDAGTGDVETIDGRETAPAAIEPDAFVDPATGEPYPFFPDLVTGGVSVGVPGTVATWDRALERWGTTSLAEALRPATRVAERGFVVDQLFHDQTLENQERFEAITSTSDLFLPGGAAPAVGSVFRNPDLAATYRLLARTGTDAFYEGALAREIVDAVQDPPVADGTTLPVPAGSMTTADLASYEVVDRAPTVFSYRGYDVYGMAPPSSGGTTVGETLNILEQADLTGLDEPAVLHHMIEASALAFADRAAYLGDGDVVDVPVDGLLDDVYARERACLLDPAAAAPKPVAAGDARSYDGECGTPAAPGSVPPDTESTSTTNLTAVDRWGDVVEYTLTIEQIGGSGIVVPGRGFLLNNELTDFSIEYDADDPNRIEPGKRPRSSMAPTIVLADGRPVLALGSPGGSNIISTVTQMLVHRIDLGRPIQEAIAAPRAAPQNSATVTAEPGFIGAYGAALAGYGHTFAPVAPGKGIGAATAVEIGPGGRLTAVAEPTRNGGGSALVVRPAGR
ncbi:gamma-glutamyltransferase [Promicromonospora thailandica]|uniref:Glutathione hydrolase proenzyme n=1 Tax=Promicromonospora thailandica TaxID=765201 RepID=A0A9X2G0I7_9MICO|nr:gamma-glutamyltransferase [Promicromonospora thailandica]MCP2263498.1 gamma-glutamyltranspeptidase / glutathione hydrolase [Promicromonospora thailandica]BFF19327.1 gamma-glutamyltransferase [Promicromonospora thailandica]